MPTTVHLYSALAPAWDRIGKLTGHDREARYFVEALPLPRSHPLAVLDLGCGSGIYSRAVLEKFPEAEVTAVDVSPAMVRACKKRAEAAGFHGRLATVTGDVMRLLPTFQAKFDLILLSGVLEYVDPKSIAEEMQRILKPGGYVLNATIRATKSGKALGKAMLFTPHAADRIQEIFAEHGLRHALTMRLPRNIRYFPSWLVKEGQFYIKMTKNQ